MSIIDIRVSKQEQVEKIIISSDLAIVNIDKESCTLMTDAADDIPIDHTEIDDLIKALTLAKKLMQECIANK